MLHGISNENLNTDWWLNELKYVPKYKWLQFYWKK